MLHAKFDSLPQSSSMKRPIIPTDFGAKVPTNVRQRYLNIFIDECVKFCPAEDAAFQMVGGERLSGGHFIPIHVIQHQTVLSPPGFTRTKLNKRSLNHFAVPIRPKRI